METDTVRDILADVGIEVCDTAQGRPRLSLEIVIDDDANAGTRTAYYDESTAKWRLRDSISKHAQAPGNQLSKAHATKAPEINIADASQRLNGSHWFHELPRSKHTDYLCTTNWSATPLGALETWEHALRLYIHMLFADERGGIIWWGPHRIAIYNQNLLPFLGSLHPKIWGQALEASGPGVDAMFRPVFEALENGQLGQAPSGLEVALERYGYIEETWWDASLISLKNDAGTYGGAYFSWLEVTRIVLRDRRTTLLYRLGHAAAVDSSSVWDHICDAFAASPRDVPMAILYDVEDSESTNQRLHLKRTLGPDTTYEAAPPILDLSSSHNDLGLVSLFCRTRDASAQYMIVDLENDHVDPKVSQNINWLGHGEPSRYMVVIPLRVKKISRGFIVLGLNPRRALDTEHEEFISDLVHQLLNLITRVSAGETSQKREKYLLKELTDTERRLSRMAEAVPTGIYDLGPDGAMLWANTSFFDIMGTPLDKRDPSTFDWRDYIIPEDQITANVAMGKALIEKVNISDNLRLKKDWLPPGTKRHPHPAEEQFWILYSASPDVRADGTVRSLMGCVTDISYLKWAEQLQVQIAEAAETEKRKQEEFIDITSHEIRNPLSAITQCADSIIASFHDIKDSSDAQSLVDVIKMNVEDAESILFCTVHQRRIINDILTLGKLDSGLLSIVPISFDPRTLVDEAMQMFKAEFEANQIEVRVVLDKASVLASTAVVKGDCARMMQILVNLLTNAIKFTRTENRKAITIRFGSSYHPPPTSLFGTNFHWNPTDTTRPDLTSDPDYGQGRDVYLYYCIIDSGKGIPGEFATRVFSKFEQADRRTYSKYGGSGLGLFISRELAELQSGRIGVESEEAVGSTFVFYTKAKCEEIRQMNPTKVRSSQSLIKDNSTSVLEAQKMENDSLYGSASKVNQMMVHRNLDYQVLLVEDNILNQRVLAKQLTKAGCTVHVANDGEEAVKFVVNASHQQKLSAQNPQTSSFVPLDCILMDWEMPICDGLTATRRIREFEAQNDTSKSVIIGITANARPEQLRKALDAGMDSIVPKPFRVPELLEKIGELVVRGE